MICRLVTRSEVERQKCVRLTSSYFNDHQDKSVWRVHRFSRSSHQMRKAFQAHTDPRPPHDHIDTHTHLPSPGPFKVSNIFLEDLQTIYILSQHKVIFTRSWYTKNQLKDTAPWRLGSPLIPCSPRSSQSDEVHLQIRWSYYLWWRMMNVVSLSKEGGRQRKVWVQSRFWNELTKTDR